MSLVEFIGFILSFLFFVILFIKRSYEKWKAHRFPDEESESPDDQHQQLKDFLKSLEDDMSETEHVPKQRSRPPMPPPAKPKPLPPKPKPALKPVGDLKTQVDKRKLQTHVEERKLETKIKDNFSGKNVLSSYFKKDEAEVDPYSIYKEVKDSRARNLLHRLKNPQEMVILHEIIGPPKALNK